MTIEYTEEEIATLRAAIVSGVLIVEYDGPPKRKVQYQSLKEMRDLHTAMTSSSSGGGKFRRVKTSKGV